MSPVSGIVVITFVCASLPALASPGVTERASVANNGAEANNSSESAAISDDGRFVAFESNAASLVPNGDHESHVYVLDRLTGAMERGVVSNTATVTANQPDPNRGDNTATETTTIF